MGSVPSPKRNLPWEPGAVIAPGTSLRSKRDDHKNGGHRSHGRIGVEYNYPAGVVRTTQSTGVIRRLLEACLEYLFSICRTLVELDREARWSVHRASGQIIGQAEGVAAAPGGSLPLPDRLSGRLAVALLGEATDQRPPPASTAHAQTGAADRAFRYSTTVLGLGLNSGTKGSPRVFVWREKEWGNVVKFTKCFFG